MKAGKASFPVSNEHPEGKKRYFADVFVRAGVNESACAVDFSMKKDDTRLRIIESAVRAYTPFWTPMGDLDDKEQTSVYKLLLHASDRKMCFDFS